MKCNKDKILTSLTPKQQRLVEKEDKEIEVMIMQADYALEKFKNGGRLIRFRIPDCKLKQ